MVYSLSLSEGGINDKNSNGQKLFYQYGMNYFSYTEKTFNKSIFIDSAV